MRYVKNVLILLAAALLMAACSNSDSETTAEVEKVPVQIAAVERGNLVQSTSFNGDIHAEYEVKIFSKIPDRIESIRFDTGDKVSKGSVLATIAATTIEQAVNQAEAALVAVRAQEANLRVEFERAKRLSTEDAMSRQQFDAVKTQYEAVQAQVRQAEAMLAASRSQFADASITAPISGLVGKRYFDAGDMASPAAPLLSIVQMDRVKITVNATEEDLGRLAIGQDVHVRVKAYPDRVFSGKVSRISPVLDPLTRMAEVEVLVDNPGHALKPGMYARVEVTTGILDNVLLVPRFATLENTTMERQGTEDVVVKNYYVYLVHGSKAGQHKLEVLYVNHEWLAVTGGVAAGDSLVVTGQNNLRDGMPVAVIANGRDQS
jgi:RND family efflux transporter MFP subunit